jgi:uncharacterized protein YegJ (DUF2314 family)
MRIMALKLKYNSVVFFGGLAAIVWIGQQIGFVPTGGTANASQSNNVALVDSFDSEMIAAKDAARASLPTFLALVSAGDTNGWDNIAIKAALGGSDMIENIWISDFADLGDGRFSGRLDNDPMNLKGLTAGDEVTFDRDQIVDWAFFQDGKGYGFYSVRALMPIMADDQKVQIAAFMASDPIPPEW